MPKIEEAVRRSPEFAVSLLWSFWQTLAEKIRSANAQMSDFFSLPLALVALIPAPLLAAGAWWYTTTAHKRYRLQREAAKAPAPPLDEKRRREIEALLDSDNDRP